ncbi:MAG: prepilin-type N-terminal cleavage/methylation domain-containing protein [Fimbriimonadaceae bacterium]|nr:prepilin-type N-terminal cleavage/methylation domain-containing protein [Fimbriimonadaceae bacterium]
MDQARSPGSALSGANRAWLPVVTVALGFFTALALYNLCLIVGPAIAQGIEVPWAPSLGTIWNPAELMPDASWLVWAVLSIVLQLAAVLRRSTVRWVALGLSVASVCVMGDLRALVGPARRARGDPRTGNGDRPNARRAEDPKASEAVSRAFTLIEVLVVTAILAILAALLFPVYAQAKDSSYRTEEISAMRQIYLAWQMYEDTVGDAPRSLGDIPVSSVPIELWRAHRDPFRSTPAGDFPADLFVQESPRRSPFRISFAYLRAFEGRFTGHTWQSLRSVPSVGLLCSVWNSRSEGCSYQGATSEHGPVRNQGVLVRIKMDGSMKPVPLPSPRACGVGGSYEELFLYGR